MDFQGDRYFTNLMNGGHELENVEQPREGDPLENSQQPINSSDYHSAAHEPKNKAKSKPRAANFKQEEDVMLVKSWMNISLDGIVGSEQKCSAYWKRIHEFYNENKTFPSDRTQGSLEHRWQVMLAEVSKLCGYMAQVRSRNQSSLNEQDRIFQTKKCMKKEKGDHFASYIAGM